MKFWKTCHKVVVVNAVDLSKQCNCYRSETATVSQGVAASMLTRGTGSGRECYGGREISRSVREVLLVVNMGQGTP